jgi:DNA repair exonuclease SbcCD ATPase subunit
MNIGPTRLVLIRSGKYEFGEIELLRPLHLIGPNNVGKTSLISTMQFLYIDRQDQMHFSRDIQQTKKYYFPDPNSYILFECMTPLGYRVVGVHGLGPVKGFDFERFTYTGELRLEDFIDEERKIRTNDAIRIRLDDRDYKLMQPGQLRAALTGIGENKGVRLELLPMRDRGGYRRFRKVFANLLRLAHISQDDLKRFLYEIYENDFQQSVIDLQTSYSSQYRIVKDSANEVKDLKAVQADISAALKLAEKRDAFRSELPQLYTEIQARVERVSEHNLQAQKEIQKERSGLVAVIEENKGVQKTLKNTLSTVYQSLGVVVRDLENLQRKTQEFSSYVLAFEEAGIARAKYQVENYDYQLKSSSAEPVRRVQARIEKNTAELHKQELLLGTISNSAVSYLKARYSDEEIARAFQLFHHDLLGMTVAEGELEVLDAEKLAATFEVLLARISGEEYADDMLRIVFPPSSKPDLQKYSDPRIITAAIEDLRAELAKDTGTLQAALQREEIQKKKDAEELALQQLIKKHHEFLEFQKESKNGKDLEKNRATLEEQKEQLEKKQSEIGKESRSHEAQVRDLDSRLKKITAEDAELKREFRSLSIPDASWSVQELYTEFPDEIAEIFQLYDEQCREERRTKEGLIEKLDAIESKTYSRIKGETEEATLRLLAEEMDALAQKEEAVENLWSGLTANLQSAIKNMLKDLDTLKNKVEHLNRQLAEVSVSNLSRLKLIVNENHQLVPRLRKVSARHDMPLFAGVDKNEEALEFVGEFLKNAGRIELLQLFELNFEVTNVEGVSQLYTKLEAIESNGTTITIKVLINLMLLRGLMDEKRKSSIPFYLDEASSLDRENVQSIVDQSLKLGFTPILASPEAMDVADNLYFLKDRNGRLRLGEDALVRLNREAGEELAQG